jgi:hypothetical protein
MQTVKDKDLPKIDQLDLDSESEDDEEFLPSTP